MVGDTAMASSEKIGGIILAPNTANTLELVRPGPTSLSFTMGNFDRGDFTGSPGSSILTVKADNLGGAAGVPNTRLKIEIPPETNTGILSGIYAAPISGTGQESLTKYVQDSDSGGPIGVTPLAAADYTSGLVLQHSDGTANFLVQGQASASGLNNSVKSLTFEPGSTLAQSSGQALELKDQMLVRSGAPSRLNGGSLQVSTLIAFGDIALDGTMVGSMTKLGPGTLILGAESALQIELAFASSYDRLQANALTFEGTVALSLALDYDPVDFVDQFTIVQVGALAVLRGATNGLFSYMGNPLSEGETFFVGAQQFSISYVAGDGNDTMLFAIPEPSAGMTAALTACSILGLRRRRRHR